MGRRQPVKQRVNDRRSQEKDVDPVEVEVRANVVCSPRETVVQTLLDERWPTEHSRR